MNARDAPIPRWWVWLTAIGAMGTLIWMITARITGPSDLWDQSQPLTVSYTTDIIANGRWILPIERGVMPATKPPLYNWLAVPAVAVGGYDSELAHKAPSLAALLGCAIVLVLVGRTLDDDPRRGAMFSGLAVMCFVSNYTIFKLGYLARPDMVLSLWLVLGWAAATALLRQARATGGDVRTVARRHWRLALATWVCVGLAGLTKGPAALTLVLYLPIAARVLCGRWRWAGVFSWRWGVPVAVGIVGWWVIAVGGIDGEHLRQELWFDEIAGRVMGTGEEGSHIGPWGLIEQAGHMPFYYLIRFLPWSVLTIGAMVLLWQRERGPVPGGRRHWHQLVVPGAWLQGAMLFVLITIGLFTFSASKRADYLAAAMAPGALLAAWWIMRLVTNRWCGTVVLMCGMLAAGVVLTVATVGAHREVPAPQTGFGEAIMAFAHGARQEIELAPDLPVVFCWSGETHLQAMLGFSVEDRGRHGVDDALAAGEPFWVVAGRKGSEPHDFGEWLIQHRGRRVASVDPRVRSATLPWEAGWPTQVSLFLVEPAGE